MSKFYLSCKKRFLRSWILLLGCLILSSSFFFRYASSLNAAGSDRESDTNAAVENETPISEIFDTHPGSAPPVDGTAYALYDSQTETFLLGKELNTPLSPASITKVMTVLLAMELLSPEQTITVTREMYEGIPEDYSKLFIVEGEVITVEDALYASLLISANDAAQALALTLAPTEAEFAQMMNERALALGCTNTHFTNSYGFADPNHLTSAHDMILILNEALKNDLYRKISTSTGYVIPATNKKNETRALGNSNRYISNDSLIYNSYIGGKTGFTDLSGYTLVAGAEKDGRRLVGTIFGASSSPGRYENLRSLFEYGFEKYSIKMLEESQFEEVRSDVIAVILAKIEAENYDFQIIQSNIVLRPLCSIRNEATNPYVLSTDVDTVTIEGIPGQQDLKISVFFSYPDDVRMLAGTLNLSLAGNGVRQDEEDTVSPPQMIHARDEDLRSTIFLFLTAAFFLFGLFFLILLWSRRRQRRRRR